MSTSQPKPTASTPPTRPSRVRLSAAGGSDKREAITRAALELFVERGFFGTAVPEIADRAGVGAGTIYRYFASKEALVNELYREQKMWFGHHVVDHFPSGLPTRELFKTMWNRMAKFACENPQAFVFMELHHHARYLDADSRALEQRMLDLFITIIASAQKRGDLKPATPRLLIGMVMGAFVGVIRSCIEVDAPLTDADWATAEQCMWEAVRA
jgi:AcrR family transcriptional regulator|nr:TetR/AcrR family transcriptional regulator [Kofleriaceae bacterium]